MLTAADFLPSTFKPKVGKRVALLEPEKEKLKVAKRAQYLLERERMANDPEYKAHRLKLKAEWAAKNRPKENKRRKTWVVVNKEHVQAYDREYKRMRAQQRKEQQDATASNAVNAAPAHRDEAVQPLQLLPLEHPAGHPDRPRGERALDASPPALPALGLAGQDDHRPQRWDDRAPQASLPAAA